MLKEGNKRRFDSYIIIIVSGTDLSGLPRALFTDNLSCLSVMFAFRDAGGDAFNTPFS